MITADLTGKRVLVTGGASGIGLATARMFGECGARIAVNHLPDDPQAAKRIAELRARGIDAEGFAGDVGQAGEAEAMVGEAVAALGGLDILINNAGTSGGSQPIPFSDLGAMTEAFWQKILSTNLLGAFRCAHAAAAALQDGSGAIVNTASISGLGVRGSSIAYAASKAALISLTRSLSSALGPHVRVNAVAPGFVDTPWTKEWSQERRSKAVERTILKRMAQPEDIAEAMLFLAAGAGYITGQTIVLDGGVAN
jgi:3-oxoacyl-[acyl-carrier protein] reductase